jgi:hypothetical protein
MAGRRNVDQTTAALKARLAMAAGQIEMPSLEAVANIRSRLLREVDRARSAAGTAGRRALITGVATILGRDSGSS